MVVTISTGAVAMRGSRSSTVTLEDFIASADRALYQVKRSGRNRVVSCGGADSHSLEADFRFTTASVNTETSLVATSMALLGERSSVEDHELNRT